MANNGQYNGAAASLIREEDLQDMEALKAEIQNRIDQARDDGRGYMMAQYILIRGNLIKEIERIRNRFNREAQAADKKIQREISKQEREQVKAQKA